MHFLENYVVFLSGFITVLIPLSFTVFIFAYKEQKEIAYSSIKKTKKVPLWGFFISLLLLVMLMIKYVPQDSDTNLTNFSITSISVVSFIWLSITAWLYNILLISINPIKEFTKNIEEIDSNVTELNMMLQDTHRISKNGYKFSKDIQKRIQKLTISGEICFQILITKEKFKMNNDFSRSLERINISLIKPIVEINKDEELFNKVTPYSGYRYFQLYVLIIKNLNLLLEVSIINKKDSDANLLIEAIKSIRPFSYSEDKELSRNWFIYKGIYDKVPEEYNSKDLEAHFKNFFNQYFNLFYQTITILSNNKDNRVIDLLDNLIIQEYDSRKLFSINDFLTLITALFMKSIESNNLKMLTDITNTYLKYSEKYIASKNENEPVINNKRIKDNLKNIRVKTNKKRYFEMGEEIETKIIRSIFFGVIKSIELGHYNCAGFLIKILVQNFNEKKVDEITKEIYKDIKNTKPNLDLSRKLTEILHVNLSFSPASYEYCFLKSSLLLWVQQEFACQQGIVPSKEYQSIDINACFESSESNKYKNYLIKKIRGLNSSYGLISLQPEYFESIVQKLETDIS